MNGIQEHQRRETFKRWWNYRGLWRESLDDQPSAASVYSGLLIAFICLYVLFIFVNPSRYESVDGIRQSDLTFTFPSIDGWIGIAFFFIVPLIVYGLLWDWGKTRNNRYIVSVLMYLMLFLIGALVALNVGSFHRLLGGFIYETFGIWWNLYYSLLFLTLLVSPILLMWIQGWRQALIFSPILVFPYYIIMWFASGSPK